MAKRADQKEKLLHVMKYLLENSDDNHHVSTEQILNYLAENGIEAERKSIYSDIKALKNFGIDIESSRGTHGYYVGARDFDLAELKLLVDSVQSSKFITKRGTDKLIRKIESLASKHDAKKLQRQVFVRNRVKAMNESVLYIVDDISTAINENCPIHFKYYDYNTKKERILRHDGKIYEVSPFALIWDDENYYLICYQHDEDKIKHFRVDKMTNVKVLEGRKREGMKKYEAIDLSSYTKTVFGMFSGKRTKVKMRFADRLAGSVIDRFGNDDNLMLIPGNDGTFTFEIELSVSDRFFGWILGFGTDAEIVHPAEVREQLKQFVSGIAEKYS